MSPGSTTRPLSLEQLSALADGELDDDAAVGAACAGWHAEATQRAAWHAYHLIGDVMRSDDLASDAERDAAFLGSLRERLAAEPVVLAPTPRVAAEAAPRAIAGVAGRRRRHLSWLAPTAVAAGFVAVAGVLVATRSVEPTSPGTLALTSGPATATPLQPVVAATPSIDVAAEPPVIVVNGQLIRDAQLDRYLAAHKQFAGSSALGVPSAFLRSATADASSR